MSSLRNDLQLEGTRPCGYYALISSSPVPLPPKRRQFVAAPMDSPGGSPPRQGWETLDDDPLGEITRRSDVLTVGRLGASCTNFFKTLIKQAMLVVFHASSRRRFFYGTILEHSTAPWPWLHVDSARVADVER